MTLLYLSHAIITVQFSFLRLDVPFHHQFRGCFSLTEQNLIVRIRNISFCTTWVVWLCSPCPPERRKKNPLMLVSLLHGGHEYQSLLKQTEGRCSWCGKSECGKGEEKKRQWKDVGVGDNKLFANQTTMSADARLEWMQQAQLFQPDCWSMWAHIFSAMGEETVTAKPMSLPFLFSPFTLPSCSSTVFISSFLSCLFLSSPHIAGNTWWHYLPCFVLLFYSERKALGWCVKERFAVKIIAFFTEKNV